MRIDVSLKGIEPDTGNQIPDGDYELRVSDVEVGPSKSSGNDMITVISEIVNPLEDGVGAQAVGREMRLFFPVEVRDDNGQLDPHKTENALRRLVKFLQDADIPYDEDGELDTQDFLGATFGARLAPQKSRPEFSEIKRTFPL